MTAAGPVVRALGRRCPPRGRVRTLTKQPLQSAESPSGALKSSCRPAASHPQCTQGPRPWGWRRPLLHSRSTPVVSPPSQA